MDIKALDSSGMPFWKPLALKAFSRSTRKELCVFEHLVFSYQLPFPPIVLTFVGAAETTYPFFYLERKFPGRRIPFSSASTFPMSFCSPFGITFFSSGVKSFDIS